MENTQVLVTKDYIFENRTKSGGWTKAQMTALGIKWPAKSGWIENLDKTFISLESARAFEAGKEVKTKRTLKLDPIIKILRGMSKKDLILIRSNINRLISKKR